MYFACWTDDFKSQRWDWSLLPLLWKCCHVKEKKYPMAELGNENLDQHNFLSPCKAVLRWGIFHCTLRSTENKQYNLVPCSRKTASRKKECKPRKLFKCPNQRSACQGSPPDPRQFCSAIQSYYIINSVQTQSVLHLPSESESRSVISNSL